VLFPTYGSPFDQVRSRHEKGLISPPDYARHQLFRHGAESLNHGDRTNKGVLSPVTSTSAILAGMTGGRTSSRARPATTMRRRLMVIGRIAENPS